MTKNYGIPTIEEFSKELINDVEKVNKVVFRPQYLVSDFSFAILNALSSAFHGMSLKTYMDEAFNGTVNVSRLALCKCHMMNTFARKARLIYSVNKEGRRNFLILCSRMIYSTSQKELDEYFRNMCILLMSKNMTNCVTAIFDGTKNEELENYGIISNMLHDVDIEPGNTYRSSTNAGLHYEQILTSVSVFLENATIIYTEANVMYNPPMVHYLMTHIMPFSMMWSGAQQETKANAIAEIVFRELKHDYTSIELSADGFMSRIHRLGTVQA